MDDVDLLSTDVSPADEEKHPGQAECGDEEGVEGDKEAKCYVLSVTVENIAVQILTSPDIHAESHERALHLGAS